MAEPLAQAATAEASTAAPVAIDATTEPVPATAVAEPVAATTTAAEPFPPTAAAASEALPEELQDDILVDEVSISARVEAGGPRARTISERDFNLSNTMRPHGPTSPALSSPALTTVLTIVAE